MCAECYRALDIQGRPVLAMSGAMYLHQLPGMLFLCGYVQIHMASCRVAVKLCVWAADCISAIYAVLCKRRGHATVDVAKPGGPLGFQEP